MSWDIIASELAKLPRQKGSDGIIPPQYDQVLVETMRSCAETDRQIRQLKKIQAARFEEIENILRLYGQTSYSCEDGTAAIGVEKTRTMTLTALRAAFGESADNIWGALPVKEKERMTVRFDDSLEIIE